MGRLWMNKGRAHAAARVKTVGRLAMAGQPAGPDQQPQQCLLVEPQLRTQWSFQSMQVGAAQKQESLNALQLKVVTMSAEDRS